MPRWSVFSAVRGSPTGLSSSAIRMKLSSSGEGRANFDGSSMSNWSSFRLKLL